MLTYGTVCSGIGVPEIAATELGWKCLFMSEIEPFPCAVLRHHYPDHPLHGDFTTIKRGDYADVNVLIGGTPCQSFSVAGKRLGLDDPRGNLAIEFISLARRLNSRWVLWENVPGVLSSAGGTDFAAFLSLLGQCGYGYAWRVLDAQYFGVPQRRRRVFVVGYLGDWRPAAAVLFERESLRGDITPRRKAREGITHELAPCIDASGAGFSRTGDIRGQDPVIPVWPADTAPTLNAAFGSKLGLEDQHIRGGRGCSSLPAISMCLNAGAMGRIDAESETLIPTGGYFEAIPIHDKATRHSGGGDTRNNDGSSNGLGIGKEGDPMPTLDTGARHAAAIQAGALRENPESGPDGVGVRDDGTSYTLEARAEVQAVQHLMAVRRLTPTECERLQGIADGYTAITYRGKPAADGPRYKAIGNSMALPVLRWIQGRIDAVDKILTTSN